MSKLVTTVLSLYVATLVYLELPFLNSLEFAGQSAMGLFVAHMIVLLVLFIIAEFALKNHISAFAGPGLAGTLKIVALSLSTVGFILMILYHIIPAGPVYHMPKFLDSFFASNVAMTIWLLAPLALLFF